MRGPTLLLQCPKWPIYKATQYPFTMYLEGLWVVMFAEKNLKPHLIFSAPGSKGDFGLSKSVGPISDIFLSVANNKEVLYISCLLHH